MTTRDFYGKKVLIFGFGLHGGGVAAAFWFFRHGAEVIVTDIKKRSELEYSVMRLTALCNEYRLSHPANRVVSIEYIFGEHREDDILTSSYIIQNPGVPRESPYLLLAREHGIPLHNDASIFFSLVGRSRIIGVTGTRGKSTTTTLIYDILKKQHQKALYAGVATAAGALSFFSILDKALESDRIADHAPIVLELSSWQLELLSEYMLSPHCAVITNVYPDHLNRYSSLDAYADAKRTLYRYQSRDEGDMAVFNYDNPMTRAMGREAEETTNRYWFSKKASSLKEGVAIGRAAPRARQYIYARIGSQKVELCPVDAYSLPGVHNLENACAAAMVATLYHVSPEYVCDALSHAKNVSGRLENCGFVDGRTVYNDTTSTTPQATIAALETLKKDSKRIILIAGGSDKGLDYEEMGRVIARYASCLVLLSGTATPHIASAVGAAGFGGQILFANTMNDAVTTAWKKSEKGDTILLSPGAASFGMFLHEFNRGDQFLKALETLQRSLKIQ